MEVRHLSGFVAVADELNFARAATTLIDRGKALPNVVGLAHEPVP